MTTATWNRISWIACITTAALTCAAYLADAVTSGNAGMYLAVTAIPAAVVAAAGLLVVQARNRRSVAASEDAA